VVIGKIPLNPRQQHAFTPIWTPFSRCHTLPPNSLKKVPFRVDRNRRFHRRSVFCRILLAGYKACLDGKDIDFPVECLIR
jgi:hypothetical protein